MDLKNGGGINRDKKWGEEHPPGELFDCSIGSSGDYLQKGWRAVGETGSVRSPGNAHAVAATFARVTIRTHRGSHNLLLPASGWCGDVLFRHFTAA